MGPAAAPQLSVIVPVRDEAQRLPRLLESLRRQTLAAECYEVIVVDNGSSDGTAEVAAEHGARVLREPRPNRSRARNVGAAGARAPLFAFTDADCVADTRWLEQLLDCAPRAPLLAGEVVLRVRQRPNRVERFEALWRFGQEAWVQQGWASTANLLVRRELFDSIGGFDVAYRHYGEDADFCLRARRAGGEIGYCVDARVEHYGEWQLRPFLRRAFMHGYGATQVQRRLGIGHRAWRDPAPALRGERAVREFGHLPEGLPPAERLAMARLARAAYTARIAGSLWAEVVRAR